MKPITLLILLSLMFSSCQKDKIIFIADHFGDCETQCLLVRENENDKWISFLENIEGFEYKEGYSYKLKVNIKKNKKEIKYSLIEILSQTKTAATATASDQGKWFVSKIERFENKTNKTPSFSINNGIIKGNTGCNSFGGDIQFDNTGIFKTGRLMFTKMYCNEFMQVENAFSSALSKARSYKLLKGKILIMDIDGNLLFTAIKEKMINPLEKKWYITSIKGFHNKSGKTPYFTIGKNFINGNNGCNSFGGKLITDNTGVFKIGELRQTEMYCEEFASLETAFSTSLSKVTHYKITDGALFLFDNSNYVIMSASSEKPVLESGMIYHLPYSIEYNVYSREFSIKNKIIEEKNSLIYSDLLPQKTDVKTKTLSKSDLKFFNDKILKIGIISLESIKSPSQKHQFDGAPSATLVIIYKGKTYTIPTFDHGNPPTEIKGIVEKIMALRLE